MCDTNYLVKILLLLILPSCANIKLPKKVYVVAREQTDSVFNRKLLYMVLSKNGDTLKTGSTNNMGVFMIKPKDFKKELGTSRDLVLEKLEVQVIDSNRSAKIYLNKYLNYYDLYLTSKTSKNKIKDSIADMHYHISMRSHNQFAYCFNRSEKFQSETPPENINWIKTHKKLRVLHKGRWKTTSRKVNPKLSYKKEKMRLLLQGYWVKSKDGANNLKHYSEATIPHTKEGRVFLGFNSISPFEHSFSMEGIKRKISSAFKSGVPLKWLERMGKDKDNYISHWENFNAEYNMITSQDNHYNKFDWEYLKRGQAVDTKLSKPLIVNVVEGGHILQDKYFPHFINYDIAGHDAKEKQNLYEEIKKKAYAEPADTVVLKILNEPNRERNKREKSELVDEILMYELKKNIDTLKQRRDIFMIAIGHLSYNGMVGHALALDVSKKPFTEKLFAGVVRRAYGIRSSNDKNLRKSFEGLFYTIPGVNKFGNEVLNRLLDTTENQNRIHIDLKHSDPLTRRVILEKYDSLDLKPICSHCAVNGLKIDFYSPLVDEYKLSNSSIVKKFYPFSINIYDEEIETICKKRGIIGLPLEERVLGGYVNNKIEWPYKIKLRKDTLTTRRANKPVRKRRWKYTFKALKYIKNSEKYIKDSEKYIKNSDSIKVRVLYESISNYYESKLDILNFKIKAGGDTTKSKDKFVRKRSFYKTIRDDYKSAEPFLQNVFHVVDIAYKDANPDSGIEIDAWKYLCLGSDLDGLIDPLNICPTAGHYPEFKNKLEKFIPLFLYMRKRLRKRETITGQSILIINSLSARH